MVGGGSRKDKLVGLNNSNVFAALDSLRKKKKKDGGSHKSTAADTRTKEQEKEVLWTPAPLTVKSWADVDDEDEDDYFATTAPPAAVWGAAAVDPKVEDEIIEESESEEEGLDEVDDATEEEHENEHEVEASVVPEPVVKEPYETSLPPKDTERQLSKKELKKKELEEFDAVLAELGYANQETCSQDDSHVIVQEKKAEADGEEQKKENATGESKSAKKKKKKEKSSKEAKESQDGPPCVEIGNGTDEIAETEKAEDTPVVDVKERLKKVASAKKKTNKVIDAAARAAASEAAARSAKLAAAKKKEKNHYYQQPMRKKASADEDVLFCSRGIEFCSYKLARTYNIASGSHKACYDLEFHTHYLNTRGWPHLRPDNVNSRLLTGAIPDALFSTSSGIGRT